jgi:hypothetical protein
VLKVTLHTMNPCPKGEGGGFQLSTNGKSINQNKIKAKYM